MKVVFVLAIASSLMFGSTCCAQGSGWSTRSARLKRTDKSHLLGALIYTDVTFEVDGKPVRTVLAYLQTITGITIVGRYDDGRTAVGIDPATPITLTAIDQPALLVLEEILDQCDLGNADGSCTWQLKRGYVEVSTRERLNRRMKTRVYPIDDLMMEAPFFENAPGLDLDAALNQGGGSGGGAGGGFGGSGGGGQGSNGSVIIKDAEPQQRRTKSERGLELVELIEDSVEPDIWTDTRASVRLNNGSLFITAPEYIHRQIGGYSFTPIRPLPSTRPRHVVFGADGSEVTE